MSLNRVRLPLNWELARNASADEPGVNWIPASVPGAVQLDWARAHGLPDYTIGDNLREWANLENSWWTYRSRPGMPAERRDDERVFLVLTGVDYACDVFVDGQWLAAQEGLQTPVEIDVTDQLRADSVLTIRIKPAPKSHPAPSDRTQADHSCKPAVAYGWDFHPRLIPLGLWNDAFLEVRANFHLSAPPLLAYQLNDACDHVAGQLELCLNTPAPSGVTVRWTLLGPGGDAVQEAGGVIPAGASRWVLPFSLQRVALWWPHDQGAAALYTSNVELIAADGRILDTDASRVGFRRVRLVMAPEQWKEPVAFPKSRSRPPITIEVNGRALFVKGSNWVCPDIFPGTVTRERYAAQLALARSSHLSLLRVWAGAAAPSEAFFELCDELGLMVWQEFPLACNRYPDAPDYLAVLDGDSRSLIRRLRGHASLVLWCGGNELFNAWSGMTEQSLPLRLLNRNCYELDPDRPFLATAPVDGMGHGHYVFRDPLTGQEAWAMFQDAACSAYSEFGCPAPASVATLMRIIPPAELWPPRAGTAWETHHAFGAWLPSSHLYLDQIEYYFGQCGSLAELVACGQLLQGLGYQGLFEEARRQKPVASMALNWCFNEPWPCAANNSLVSWPCEPKPALRIVAQACRPTLASARIRRFAWNPGELFAAELWLLHDGPEAARPHRIVATLILDGVRLPSATWTTGVIEANRNVAGPRIEWRLPEFSGPLFELELDVPECPQWSSRYTLIKARSHPAEAAVKIEVAPGTTNF